MYKVTAAQKDSLALLRCLALAQCAKHGLSHAELSKAFVKSKWIPNALVELNALKIPTDLFMDLMDASFTKSHNDQIPALAARLKETFGSTNEARENKVLHADENKRDSADKSWNLKKRVLLTSLIAALVKPAGEESKTALNRFKTEIGELVSPELNSMAKGLVGKPDKDDSTTLEIEERPTSSSYASLIKLTKPYAKTACAPFLNLDEIKALKESNPKVFEQVSTIVKQLGVKFKAAVKEYVNSHRTEDFPAVPFKDVYKAVTKQLGYDMFSRTDNYNDPDVYIDAEGKAYTYELPVAINLLNYYSFFQRNQAWVKGKKEDVFFIRNIPVVGKGPDIASITGNRPLGGWNKYATVKRIQERKQAKNEKIMNALPHSHEFVAAWRHDLSEGDDNKKTLASICELAYLTNMRLQQGGSKSINKEEKGETVGIATLLNNNVTLTKDSITLDFVAKSFRHQNRKITLADVKKSGNANDVTAFTDLLASIKRLKSGKSANAQLFTFDGKPIPGGTIDDYIRKATGGALTAHPLFRHLKADKLFNEGLDSFPNYKPPLNTKQKQEIKEKFDALTKEIGDDLGHQRTDKEGVIKSTGATAISFYIPLPSLLKYYRKYNMPIPPAIKAKAIEQGLKLFSTDQVDLNDNTTIDMSDSDDDSDADASTPDSTPDSSVQTPTPEPVKPTSNPKGTNSPNSQKGSKVQPETIEFAEPEKTSGKPIAPVPSSPSRTSEDSPRIGVGRRNRTPVPEVSEPEAPVETVKEAAKRGAAVRNNPPSTPVKPEPVAQPTVKEPPTPTSPMSPEEAALRKEYAKNINLLNSFTSEKFDSISAKQKEFKLKVFKNTIDSLLSKAAKLGIDLTVGSGTLATPEPTVETPVTENKPKAGVGRSRETVKEAAKRGAAVRNNPPPPPVEPEPVEEPTTEAMSPEETELRNQYAEALDKLKSFKPSSKDTPKEVALKRIRLPRQQNLIDSLLEEAKELGIDLTGLTGPTDTPEPAEKPAKRSPLQQAADAAKQVKLTPKGKKAPAPIAEPTPVEPEPTPSAPDEPSEDEHESLLDYYRPKYLALNEPPDDGETTKQKISRLAALRSLQEEAKSKGIDLVEAFESLEDEPDEEDSYTEPSKGSSTNLADADDDALLNRVRRNT